MSSSIDADELSEIIREIVFDNLKSMEINAVTLSYMFSEFGTEITEEQRDRILTIFSQEQLHKIWVIITDIKAPLKINPIEIMELDRIDFKKEFPDLRDLSDAVVISRIISEFKIEISEDQKKRILNIFTHDQLKTIKKGVENKDLLWY